MDDKRRVKRLLLQALTAATALLVNVGVFYLIDHFIWHQIKAGIVYVLAVSVIIIICYRIFKNIDR